MTQAFNLSQFANKLNSSGQTDNTGLQNNSVTVLAGTGMSGGGSVALGSSITLTNAGVTSVNGSTGAVTVSSSYIGLQYQLFTASGTFTVPSGITAVKVTFIGSGGGGGGGGSYASTSPGGSGTSGGTSSFGSYISATGGTFGTGGYGVSCGCGTVPVTGTSGTRGGNTGATYSIAYPVVTNASYVPYGAGGGGGGGTSGFGSGGSGGGGGYGVTNITGLTSGGTVTVTIGAGGTGGTAAGAGASAGAAGVKGAFLVEW